MSDPRLEEINLNLLLALDALLLEENVTRAARRIGVTQPAMSRSLGSLRVLLSDELLIRVGNEMQPTPYALALRPGLHRSLADLQRLLRTAGDFEPSSAQGMVRIAAAGHIAARLGPTLVAVLEADAPNLNLRFEQLDSARLIDAIVDGVDVALGPAIDVGATLDSRVLFRDPFVCLVRAAHPLLASESQTLDGYLRYPHIVISPTGRGGSAVDRELADRGLTRRVLVQVESFLLAPAIVASTDLVLTAPRSTLSVARDLMKISAFEPPFPLSPLRIAAYWDPRRRDEPRIQWILELLTRALGRGCGRWHS